MRTLKAIFKHGLGRWSHIAWSYLHHDLFEQKRVRRTDRYREWLAKRDAMDLP